MILYLSSPQHTNLLDFTGFYEPDSEVPVKKMVGNFVLKQFVVYDMRSFAHFTDVVLDRPAFGDTDEEFAQAIEEFLTMYSARVTVICEGLTQAAPLFQALLDSGVGNIVCDTEIEGIQQEIRECLSGQGMTRYAAKERPDRAGGQEKYRFDCRNVVVVVIGSQARIGTTTAAVGLCAWLARVGASVCYVEAHAGGHLAALARGYEMKAEEGGWQFEGVRYRSTEPKGDVNFVVHDLGSDFAGKRELLENADIKLLVCGTKPYELGFTVRLQASLAGIYAYLLCPFVAEGMKDDLAEALQNDYHKVMFSEYQPELTDSDCNGKQYKNLIGKYIAG
ncbi:hypothetical protein [uncultured Acetatifactor sp.]|jgi:hypothetical protein|uniref:hypothetical protein n=1 Tax=uncultured Acetatifactor sp. TaxID=1671927 RepID=UPI0026160B7C|nr:hypothetical protein [uncultured Acetatifactor sp.]